MSYGHKLTEIGGRARVQLSGGTVRKGFLEKADFELGPGDSLNPGSPVIVSEGRPYGPTPEL